MMRQARALRRIQGACEGKRSGKGYENIVANLS